MRLTAHFISLTKFYLSAKSLELLYLNWHKPLRLVCPLMIQTSFHRFDEFFNSSKSSKSLCLFRPMENANFNSLDY